jgi:hypothetical protein
LLQNLNPNQHGTKNKRKMTFLGLLKVELSDKGEILKILKHAILVQICRESERER